MTIIELTVKGTDVKAKVHGPLTEGMVGARVAIRYDDSWEGLSKTLVCRSHLANVRDDEVRTVVNVGNQATIAHEVMIAGRTLYLGVEGYAADGTEVIPTIWAECGEIQKGANADADPSVAATPEVWEQLLAQMGSLDGLNTDEKGTLVAAINEAMTKGNGLPGKDGRGVSAIAGNDDGSWTVSYTDDTEETISSEAYRAIAEQVNLLLAEVAEKEQLTPGFANSISECTDTSKLYVLPDGYIYAYLLDTESDVTESEWRSTGLAFGGEDGVGIASIDYVESTESGGSNYLNITLTDGSIYMYPVKNGEDGVDGTDGRSVIYCDFAAAGQAVQGTDNFNTTPSVGDLVICADGSICEVTAALSGVYTLSDALEAAFLTNEDKSELEQQVGILEEAFEFSVASDNKFDNVFDETGKIDVTTGEDAEGDNWKRTSAFYDLGDDFGGTVYMATTELTYSPVIVYYDENKTFVGYNVKDPNSTTIANRVQTNAKYFRVYAAGGFTGSLYISGVAPESFESVDYSYRQEPSHVKADKVPKDGELEDIRIGYDGTEYETAGKAVREQIAKVMESDGEYKAIIETSFGNVVTSAFDGVETGKVYSSSFPSGASLSSYNTYYKAVNPGEAYYITTTVVANSSYCAACFFAEDGSYISGVGSYADVGTEVTNYEFTVPNGAVLMRATTKNSVTPVLSQKMVTPINIHNALITAYRNYVSFVDGNCVVTAPYGENENVVFTIYQGGGNNLPDIRNVAVVNTATGETRTLVSSATDILSPHIMAVADNADGDNIKDDGTFRQYFTGGNHQYDNSGSGSVATARCESFGVWCDGAPVTDGVHGNEIIVGWRNYIQAYNTTKADGTGREVLVEDVRLTITGATIKVNVRHTALEDIIRNIYYGLQMVTGRFSTIEFIGGSNRGVYGVGNGTNCGNTACRAIRLANDTSDVLEIHIDDIDLGDFALNTFDHTAFDTTANKSYFNIIKYGALAQAAGEVTTTRGYYHFFADV